MKYQGYTVPKRSKNIVAPPFPSKKKTAE